MGKIFVKSPVESPDDLLAKQTTVAPRLAGGGAGLGVRDFFANRNYTGAGKEALASAAKFTDPNQIQNFNQFIAALSNPFIALFGRKPQTPEEQEYARQMIRIEQQDRIKEQMRPARETQALQELKEKYGLSPNDVRQYYANLSPIEALNQERIVQQGIGRDVRRANIFGEQGSDESQATKTAQEIEAASDAGENKDAMAAMVSQGKRLRVNEATGGMPSLPSLTPEQVEDIRNNIDSRLQTLQDNMGEIPDLTSNQGVVGQEQLHAEMEKNNQNMDPLSTQGAGPQSLKRNPVNIEVPDDDDGENNPFSPPKFERPEETP